MAFPLSYPERNQGLDEEQNTGTLLDCSVPVVFVPQNEFKPYILRLNSQSATEMLSALQVGSELTYPEKYQEIVDRFLEAIHCQQSEGEGDCINYLPYASFINFYPQNPYTQPDYVPPDYAFPPFLVNNQGQYAGYDATDVLVPLAAINLNPIDLFTGDLPQIQISVKGSGQIELDLLATQNGGYAILKLNAPPNILDIIAGIYDPNIRIIELNSDLVAIPPETDIVVAEEFDIQAASPEEINTLYITFYPKTDDALLPLGFGGGLRRVGLCGLEIASSEMQMTDIRLTNCGIEVLQNGVWIEKISQAELDACFGGGGGGGGVASISTFTKHVYLGALQSTSSTSFVNVSGSEFSHIFTKSNALIIASANGYSGGAAHMFARVVIDNAGVVVGQNATEGRTATTSPTRELRLADVFPNLPIGVPVNVQIQFRSTGAQAFIHPDYGIIYTIIEYDDASELFVEDIRIQNRELQKKIGGVWLTVSDSLDAILDTIEAQVLNAQNTANSAQIAANQAQTTANAAQTDAGSALSENQYQQNIIADHENRITTLENAGSSPLSVWSQLVDFSAGNAPLGWNVERGNLAIGGIYAQYIAPLFFGTVGIQYAGISQPVAARTVFVKFIVKDDGTAGVGTYRPTLNQNYDVSPNPKFYGAKRIASDTVEVYFRLPDMLDTQNSQIGLITETTDNILWRLESMTLYGFGENPFI